MRSIAQGLSRHGLRAEGVDRAPALTRPTSPRSAAAGPRPSSRGCPRSPSRAQRPRSRGHIGDGSRHINSTSTSCSPITSMGSSSCGAPTRRGHASFSLVKRHHGSISAEHGMGLLKRDYLPYPRSAEELAIMRSIKRALDPLNLMNPGKRLEV
ncbi:FAD-linked oxidase C-terminal domain-containing protein [Sorangium sp. So ce204]|uniref:FAD-linked oxidase C-terminal domain-containing protein n=1 Tax=Sorangium sp. So ce204 TaxID=3133288 RepID=UPI003F626F11